NRTFNPLSSARSEHIVERALGYVAQAGQRQRFQRPWGEFVWCALPIYMIKNIADAADSTPAHPCDADGAEPLHQNTRLAGFVIKSNASIDELIRALDHAGADPCRGSRGTQKYNSAKSDRQFQLRAACFDGRTTSGEHV